MRLLLRAGALAPAVLVILSIAGAPGAQSAGPAVSGPNGKIEFDAGALSVPTGFVGRAAGTVTLPVGARFGIQADFSAGNAGGSMASAAFHVFTRDPQSYLIGGTLGAIRTPGATVVAAGPEAELYLGQWTVEAWGGVALARPTSGAGRTGAFGMAEVAYYPDPNLRISGGFSVLDGFAALHVGGEYLLGRGDMPLSFTTDARLGQDGSILATVGLRLYVGGGSKPLIARHREDDPWDRGGSLFSAVPIGGGAASTASGGTSSGGDTSSGGGSGGNGKTQEECVDPDEVWFDNACISND